MHRRGDEAGFTLVELLVSLAITASAAALLCAVLWSGNGAWRRAEISTTGGESVAAAQQVLRDRIGHLVSDATGSAGLSDTAGAGAAAPIDAMGDARGFTFVAAPPAARAPGVPLRYIVQVDRAGRLALSTIDARAAVAGVGRARWRVAPLLGNVDAVQFAYYGAPTPQEAPRWWPAWPGIGDPPALVRVRLRFARGDTRRWPDLVIRPAVGVSATCRVSPDSGDCIGA